MNNNGTTPSLPIKIKLNEGIMPTKGSEFAAAYDLYIPEDVELKYGRQVIDLKFSMELPHGYAAIIQPRSGFTCKGMQVQAMIRHWWFMLLGIFSKEKRVDADVIVGLVDEDYRHSVGALVKSNYLPVFRKAIIPKGTRIAQMRIVQVPQTELVEAEELDMTKNRGGGYGHTGVK
jgi:dUTP pyrophosphatase